MSKFVFYVIDLDDGTVKGSNDTDEVEDFLTNDQYIVLHQNGSYFCGSREEHEVTAIESESSDDDDDDHGIYGDSDESEFA